jgi:hypothetical protein
MLLVITNGTKNLRLSSKSTHRIARELAGSFILLHHIFAVLKKYFSTH